MRDLGTVSEGAEAHAHLAVCGGVDSGEDTRTWTRVNTAQGVVRGSRTHTSALNRCVRLTPVKETCSL